jgi:hypothetical protein
MTDSSNLLNIFNEYINGEHPVNPRVANQLWDLIEAQALHIAPQYAEEMTGILMTRLFNRRNRPHQPINTPKSYINTALKNIRTDLWRRDKRFAGYQDHMGEFHYHQSLDAMVFDDGPSMHELIPSEAPPSEPVVDLEATLLSIIRTYLYEEEIKLLTSHTTDKGKRTFLECAYYFQPFALNQYHPGDQTKYKRFDRQRQKFLEHFTTSIENLDPACMAEIRHTIEQHGIDAQRHSILTQYQEEHNINGEIIARQIDLQLALKTLVQVLQQRNITTVTLNTLLEDAFLRGLMIHCEYQIFRSEGYRTKRSKNASIESLYFENV